MAGNEEIVPSGEGTKEEEQFISNATPRLSRNSRLSHATASSNCSEDTMHSRDMVFQAMMLQDESNDEEDANSSSDIGERIKEVGFFEGAAKRDEMFKKMMRSEGIEIVGNEARRSTSSNITDENIQRQGTADSAPSRKESKEAGDKTQIFTSPSRESLESIPCHSDDMRQLSLDSVPAFDGDGDLDGGFGDVVDDEADGGGFAFDDDESIPENERRLSIPAPLGNVTAKRYSLRGNLSKPTDEHGRRWSASLNDSEEKDEADKAKSTTKTAEEEDDPSPDSPSSKPQRLISKKSFRDLFKRSPTQEDMIKKKFSLGESKEEQALSLIMRSNATSVEVVSKLLRTVTRKKSMNRRNSLGRNEYFDDHTQVIDYDQQAMRMLIEHTRQRGDVEPQVWRRPQLVSVVPYGGDVNLIPPMLCRMIKTGHVLDGDGYFPEIDALLAKKHCLVLKFTPAMKPNFYTITKAETYELYGELGDISFADVCKDRGEDYAECIRLIPGVRFLEQEGLIVGARRRGKLETFRASEIGLAIKDRVVCEAHWRGQQVIEAGNDAFVIINNTAGPYLIDADGDHPSGYRKFYDYTQEQFRNLVETAANDITIQTQKWQKPGVTCLFFYNGDTSLIPISVYEALGGMAENVLSRNPTRRASRAATSSFDDNLGFEDNDVIVMQFARDGSPNFYPITSSNARKLYTGFRNTLTFEDVLEAAPNADDFKKFMFNLDGVEELVRNGHILGGRRRGFAQTYRASDLGLPIDDYICVEANWNGPQEIQRGKDAFVVVNNHRGPYLLYVDDDAGDDDVSSTKIDESLSQSDKRMWPVGYEPYSSAHDKEISRIQRKDSMHQAASGNVVELLRDRANRLGNLALPLASRIKGFRIILWLALALSVCNVVVQCVAVMMHATVSDSDDLVRSLVTALWIVLPFVTSAIVQSGSADNAMARRMIPLFSMFADTRELVAEKGNGPLRHEQNSNGTLWSLTRMRFLLLLLQCAPQALSQSFFAFDTDSTTVQSISILTAVFSCITAGVLSTAIGMDFDGDPRKREEDRIVFGYYPEETDAQLCMFTIETIQASCYATMRCVALGTAFALLAPIYVLMILGIDLIALTLLRVGFRNFVFYHRVDRVRNTLLSHIVVYISTEIVPINVVRSPFLLGGALTILTSVLVILENFAIVLLAHAQNSDEDEYEVPVFLDRNSALLAMGATTFGIAFANAVVPLAMSERFDIRFWARHGTPRRHFREYAWHSFEKNAFGPTIDDHRGFLLEVWHPSYWSFEIVRDWLASAQNEWNQDPDIIPEWFSERWKSNIPAKFFRPSYADYGNRSSARVVPIDTSTETKKGEGEEFAFGGDGMPMYPMSPSTRVKGFKKAPDLGTMHSFEGTFDHRTYSNDSVRSANSNDSGPKKLTKRKSWVEPAGLAEGNGHVWNPLEALEMKIKHLEPEATKPHDAA